MFGTPSRITRVASPQLPALAATIAGGAAATAAPAEAAQTPRINEASNGVIGPKTSFGVIESQVSPHAQHKICGQRCGCLRLTYHCTYTVDTCVAVQRRGARVLSVGPERRAVQAAASADEPPAPVRVFGKGSKSAPAFGLAALSSPRTPPAQSTPAMPPATAQIGAAVGSLAPPSIMAHRSAGVAGSAPDSEGVAAVPEASAMGKRQRESEDG